MHVYAVLGFAAEDEAKPAAVFHVRAPSPHAATTEVRSHGAARGLVRLASCGPIRPKVAGTSGVLCTVPWPW